METSPVRLNKATLNKVKKFTAKNGGSISRFYDNAAKDKLAGGLISRLKKDKKLYYTWQCSIAMAFKDEFAKRLKGLPAAQWPYSPKVIHQVANDAAKTFLNLLIS